MSTQIIRTIHYLKWKQLEAFPNFFVSNTGLVRFKSTVLKPKFRKGRIDYYYIIATNHDTGSMHRLDIHRLVWDHFGNEPHQKGYEVHHIDENPTNNNISNLELLPLIKHRRKHERWAIKTGQIINQP